MTPTRELGSAGTPARTWTLVWIDAREALVMTWSGTAPVTRRLVSEVPVHTDAMPHVRHDPLTRHGGGMEHDAADLHRKQHVRRFLEQVVAALPVEANVKIMGHGDMLVHLAGAVRQHDERRPAPREIVVEPSELRTARQLAAHLRELVGAPARRRTSGSWRWSGEQPHRVSGQVVPPRRTAVKRVVEAAEAPEPVEDLPEETPPRSRTRKAP